MIMKRTSLYKFIAVVVFIAFWSFVLIFVDPQKVVISLGVNNSLALIFLIATMGGVSTLTSFSFYSTLITLAVGGVNPFLLGIVGGIGITIGDSLFYYLGKSGRRALYGKPKEWAKHISTWLNSKPKWVVPVFTFAYSGMTPFPNDILAVSLGLSGRRYRSIVIPLLLGNVFLTILVAYLASQGWF